jgi:hypothetical protein
MEPMVWIKKAYIYWQNMHSLTNYNFCDKCGNAVWPEIIHHYIVWVMLT